MTDFIYEHPLSPIERTQSEIKLAVKAALELQQEHPKQLWQQKKQAELEL